MQAPHAGSLRDRHHNAEKTYGPIKRSRSLESLFALEDIIHAISPLPTTYDVFAIQSFYFNEFGYTDLWGGMYLYPLGYEASARIMERAVNDYLSADFSGITLPEFDDKYVLRPSSAKNKRIIFLPGSNLLHAINFDAVERLLYSDDTVMVKPHPITTMEGLRLLGAKVGFDRIIDPRESGLAYLDQCERAWGTANSEIGLRAALLKIPYTDITANQWYPSLTYSALHRLFTNDVERNYKVVCAALTAPHSGLLMPWNSEEENVRRAREFFKAAIEIREMYKPMYPRHVPVKFSPPQPR